MTEPEDLIGRRCPWGYNVFSESRNRMMSLCQYKNCPYYDGKYTGIICTSFDGYDKECTP